MALAKPCLGVPGTTLFDAEPPRKHSHTGR